MYKLLLILPFLVACNSQTGESLPNISMKGISASYGAVSKRKDNREWKVSSKGVIYYADCIEGVRYIATKSNAGYIQFAYTGKQC